MAWLVRKKRPLSRKLLPSCEIDEEDLELLTRSGINAILAGVAGKARINGSVTLARGSEEYGMFRKLPVRRLCLRVVAIVDQATGNRAEVLLVGDHHQLPEVAAGGAFRAALDVLGDRVVELTTNRRQRHAWERAALDQLRGGDVRAAFDAYRDHGRIVIADRPDDLHALVLGDWLDAHAEVFANAAAERS